MSSKNVKAEDVKGKHLRFMQEFERGSITCDIDCCVNFGIYMYEYNSGDSLILCQSCDDEVAIDVEYNSPYKYEQMKVPRFAERVKKFLIGME